MKRCLADVNVLLALLVRHHDHHVAARKWFDGLEAGEAGLCRLVQLAIIRLLGNSAIMADHAISPAAAWVLLEELLLDERIDFTEEPPLFDSVFPTLLKYRGRTSKLVGDAYLAAFAMASSRRMVSLDSGFRQFKGLELELLSG
jgi:toxin-antitoxin system PIN domain toxin